MNAAYVLPRLVRHFMPEALVRFMLQRRWLLRPGLETTDPAAAVDRYLESIRTLGTSIEGRRVLVFGYGGRYAVAIALLSAGARHVVLCEHYVMPDRRRNLELLPEHAKYLDADAEGVRPRPEYITLLHGDIRSARLKPVEIALSTSVFEHLSDVDGITRALAERTVPGGLHIHYVDLRDHFFRYPFEMLCYTERAWQRFLDPSSHLNRLRADGYQRVFRKYFGEVLIEVRGSDPEKFQAARSRIRPEFLSGDAALDATTLIQIVARSPRSGEPV